MHLGQRAALVGHPYRDLGLLAEPDLARLDPSLGHEADLLGGKAQPEPRYEVDGEGDHEQEELTPAEEQPAEEQKEPDRPEEEAIPPLVQDGHLHLPSSRVQSTLGTGTVSSARSITSSAATSRIHSSGFSMIRWTSAGLATAFTSSGRT